MENIKNFHFLFLEHFCVLVLEAASSQKFSTVHVILNCLNYLPDTEENTTFISNSESRANKYDIIYYNYKRIKTCQ